MPFRVAGGRVVEPDFHLVFITNEADVNLFTRLGSPATAKLWKILVLNNITLFSSSTSIPALRTTGSFPVGTTFELTLQGAALIVGRGGNGGAGGSFPEVKEAGGYGGGGGGGAGALPGAGGASGGGGALPGATGGTELGGGGGAGQFVGGDVPIVGAGSGLAGGTALETHYPMTLKKDGGSGRIWGGGGGGAGAQIGNGAAGGNAGTAGGTTSAASGGAAGAAISVQGSGSITYTPNKAAFDIRGSAPA